jgi:hypothetical protein
MQLKLIPRHRFVAIYFLFVIFLASFDCNSYSVLAQSKQQPINANKQDGSSRGRPTRRRGTGSHVMVNVSL